MRNNILTAHYREGELNTIGTLYQWDYGQRIVFEDIDLPQSYEVHFSNNEHGESITQIGDETGVDIPDELLQTGKNIVVWIYLHTGTDDGETVYRYYINVRKRAEPVIDTPTPVQQNAITQAIAALNVAVEDAQGYAGDAAESAADAETAKEFLENVSATAETLPAGSSATAQYAEGVFSFGVPKGDPGDPAEIIDDTAGAGATDKAWSADKLTGEFGGKVDKVEGKGLSANDYTDEDKQKVAEAVTDISGKADKVTNAAGGNFAGLDSNGNLTDSGHKHSDYIQASEKGAASGIAELDSGGKVPTSQLPSYVDDVLEFASREAFPATGETGKIYVALDTNLTYRWSGSAYVEISPSLALGETDSTAYRGDRGAAAYAAAVTNVDTTPTENSTHLITSGGVKAAIPDITGKADKVASATSGNFAALDGNGNLTDSGHKHSDYLTEHQDISGKADKVSGATSGNFAGLDANGNLTDSGSKASDFATPAELEEGLAGKADNVGAEITTMAAVQTFTDGANSMPMEVTVAIDPVQDLHGYEYPWPAGALGNYFDQNTYSNKTNYKTTYSGYKYTNPIILKANTEYTFNEFGSGSLASGIYFYIMIVSGNDPTATSGNSGIYPVYNGSTTSAQAGHTFTTGATGAIRFGIPSTITDENFAKIFSYNWQLEEGDTPTTWHPYSNICPISGWTGCNVTVSPTQDAQDGNTYSITFPTPPGTVYGGTLKVNKDGTGTLSVDKEIVEFTGDSSEVWTYNAGSGYASLTFPCQSKYGKTQTPIANYLRGVSNRGSSAMNDWDIAIITGYTNIIVRLPETFTSASDWTTYLSTNHLSVVFELVTPTTYTLTASEVGQILSLYGVNNVWADTGNVLSIAYSTPNDSGLSGALSYGGKVLVPDDRGVIAVDEIAVTTETVSGTTPTITGVANHRYICGEVSTISIAPPDSGMIDVVFTSGTTAAVLTLPNTVKMPEWFSVEASKTYEINILDGTYGVVSVWA